MDVSNWANRDKVLGELLDRFGSMNKNDYEVALFGLMLKNNLKDKSDFIISCQLKIPESKVKRLRYEVNLNSIKSASYDEEVRDYLDNCAYQISGERVRFSIPDKFMRQYLCDKLAQLNTFCDSSFNSDIVSVSGRDLMLLFSSLHNMSVNDMLEIIDKSVKKHNGKLPDRPGTLAEGVLQAIIKDLGARFAPNLMDFMVDRLDSFKEIFKKQ